MGLAKIYKQLALSSPHIEVVLRYLYWHNVKRLRKYRPVEHKVSLDKKSVFNFEKITNWLREQGVTEGKLIVVHSSYDNISGCGLKPNEIIRELRALIGETGTLAMPVIRHYKEMPSPLEWRSTDYSKIVCHYDPRRTPVASGLLPSLLMREKGACVSLHPLNTMAAVGPLAVTMMEHNLDGDKPSPHGPQSSWKFCLDHDAIIVALGVPMIHHLTIAHVSDEAFDMTPFEDWYNELQFDIVMPDKTVLRKTVCDRKPKWGMIHDAEINFGHDLEKAAVIHLAEIDGVSVGVCRAQELIKFMKSQKNKAYPYYKIF